MVAINHIEGVSEELPAPVLRYRHIGVLGRRNHNAPGQFGIRQNPLPRNPLGHTEV